MSVDSHAFDVPGFINQKSVGASQYLTVLLCGLVMFLDGFDTQSISYMAPSIAKEFGLSRDMLGPIFSSALAGLMIGYLALSPLSDRYGHRRVILVSTIAFGLTTLVTAFASNVTELIVLRFVTGLFLGSAAPSAIALTGEYSPTRLRATSVLAIYCGFSLGFVAAGAVAAWTLPLHGWRSLLWIGGITPLVLAVFLYAFLNESLDFLIRSAAPPQRIWQILRRTDRTLPATAPAAFTTTKIAEGNAIGGLFSSGRLLGTLVLWVANFVNLGEFYALQSWLPTILTNLRFPLGTVALATTLTTMGGIAIAIVIGPAMDRLGPYLSLSILYLCGMFFVALLGWGLSSPLWVLMVAAFLTGCSVSGGQKSLNALAAVFYPAPIRSTGVGWTLGVGRLGGIGGPLLLGLLFSWNVSPAGIFYAAAIPMFVSALLIAFLGWHYGESRRRLDAFPREATSG